ncbi:uncharacterized protein Fot_38136 [Forsythia ovata]|uniref:Uncharacterized protein n=1 Tax=Forsythia ovata TaxID=205694 RepID=A0ABD1S4Z0_9LAMI
MDRVVEELRAEENSEDFYGEFDPPQSREKSANPNDQQEEYISRIEEKEDGDSEDDNEDFEFAFLTRESQISSPISADEIFCNGQIRPVFTIFERDLLLRNMNLKRENLGENGTENSGSSKGPSRTVRLPLRKLFIEERETASSGGEDRGSPDPPRDPWRITDICPNLPRRSAD